MMSGYLKFHLPACLVKTQITHFNFSKISSLTLKGKQQHPSFPGMIKVTHELQLRVVAEPSEGSCPAQDLCTTATLISTVI